jgi:hypothetical protein
MYMYYAICSYIRQIYVYNRHLYTLYLTVVNSTLEQHYIQQIYMYLTDIHYI